LTARPRIPCTSKRCRYRWQLNRRDSTYFAEISVQITAAGSGFNRVSADQKVEVELGKAKHELKIKDTAGWVATVIGPAGKRELDVSKSYAENNLSGKVEIDWGPKEGGGG
jgi:hypothetical protein